MNEPIRRFELTDGTSSKFWAIELNDHDTTVSFGRIGGAGRTQTKSHESPAAAQLEYTSLIAQKLRKGYIEVDSRSAVVEQPDHHEAGQSPETSGDLHAERRYWLSIFTEESGTRQTQAGAELLRLRTPALRTDDQGGWIVDAEGTLMEERYGSIWQAEVGVTEFYEFQDGPFFVIDHEGNAWEVDENGNQVTGDGTEEDDFVILTPAIDWDAAGNPHTDPQTLARYAAGDDWNLKFAVARNESAPPEALALLASGDLETRRMVAGNLSTPTQVLDMLASDSSWEVRAYVARNSRTPIPLLERLSTDNDRRVRSAVAQNGGTPMHVRQALANDY